MADVQYYEEKVQKATEKVEKCKGTIARHEKGLDKKIQGVIKAVGIDLTGKTKAEIEELKEPYRGTDHSWSFYEVIGKLDDIKGATKKLADAERILGNWQEKLNVEIEKERFIEGNAPQVIKDFLEEWKAMAHQWHIKRYNGYQDFKKKLDEDVLQARIDCIKATPEYHERYLDEDGEVKKSWDGRYDLLNVFPRKPMDDYLKERNLDYRSIQARKADFAGGAVMYMDTIYKEEERLAWLEKTLEQEKKHKMIDLIHRINAVVGTITDATDLRIKAGNLNGIIVGEKGKAKVETIGAGGWNVQVFHYRTLVHEVK